MKFTLMHMSHPVLDMVQDQSGHISEITDVHDLSRAPVGTVVGDRADAERLRIWWTLRNIPSKRPHLDRIMEAFGIPDREAMPLRSLGLCISDRYWLRPEGSDRRWEDVNFFDNGFSDDVGDMLFDGSPRADADWSSPEPSTDGVLPKRWMYEDGTLWMVKTGTAPHNQEPYDEAVAPLILEAMGIDHVPYEITNCHGRTCCRCRSFVDRRIEFVRAYQAMYTMELGDRPLYDHYVDCCDRLGIDILPSLDRLMTADFVLCNGDRHPGNFGLLRDAETLEWLGPAPVFDCGTSLGCALETLDMQNAAEGSCKPFRDGFLSQIELVTTLDWVDFDALRSAVE